MSTPITTLDLTLQAPHSPRDRLAGFVIAKRTIDKCRARIANKLGDFHYDCPLDNKLFSFKEINGVEFEDAVQDAKSYEEVGVWLLENGAPKTADEIQAWSNQMESSSLMSDPEKRDFFIEQCTQLGLNPESSTLFDMIEADDRATFKAPAA